MREVAWNRGTFQLCVWSDDTHNRGMLNYELEKVWTQATI